MLETTITRAAGANPWRRLGKIKLGLKVPTGSGEGTRPQDVDYFVIPDAPGANPHRYREALGEKPRELSIVLANPELLQNFDSRAVMYLANGAKACHTADGKEAMRYQRPQGEERHRWVRMACPGADCEFRQKKQCKERGYFSFMIPQVGDVGVFLLIMGSQVATTQIYNALRMVESLCQGRPNGMAGIRLKLRREPKEFYQDLKGDGRQAKVTKYIPMVEIDFQQLLQEDQKRLSPLFAQPILLGTSHEEDVVSEVHDGEDE
jgi:hypothetical protein